jgi:hypothetical protein
MNAIDTLKKFPKLKSVWTSGRETLFTKEEAQAHSKHFNLAAPTETTREASIGKEEKGVTILPTTPKVANDANADQNAADEKAAEDKKAADQNAADEKAAQAKVADEKADKKGK